MALLEWSAALELQSPVMDGTHREFVALLNALDEAADGDMLARMDAFIAHTEQHFGTTLATALAEWFPQHAQSMDAVLALYLREKKIDVTAD